jgi:hypothetical protein
MPIPLIIGGAALLAGAFGVKKGIDAKGNFATAKALVATAEHDFESAKESLEEQKAATHEALKRLGGLRLKTQGERLARYVTLVKHVHTTSHKQLAVGSDSVALHAPVLSEIEVSAYEAADILKDGMRAVPQGVLAGFGAAGLATQVGVASTGAAISGLSGAAATNATLAWLGGGSLASGGFGMAGGAAVLGGAVAGPALALMGMAAAAKSEKALTEATAREAELRECIEQVNNGHNVLVAIETRVNELHTSLHELGKRFDRVYSSLEPIVMGKVAMHQQLSAQAQDARATYEQRFMLLRWLDRLLGRAPDFSIDSPLQFDRFLDAEKKLYMQLLDLATALNSVSRVQVLDEAGNLLESSQAAIDTAARAIEMSR